MCGVFFKTLPARAVLFSPSNVCIEELGDEGLGCTTDSSTKHLYTTRGASSCLPIFQQNSMCSKAPGIDILLNSMDYCCCELLLLYCSVLGTGSTLFVVSVHEVCNASICFI